MRVVFMGTPEFAVPSLRALVVHHEVAGVYTRQDAVSGRGASRRPSAVKQAALQLTLPVHQPSTLRDPLEWERLGAMSPDIIAVAAYGLILPREVLEIPRHGCINVHASLLPRWRGAAPIQRAILQGDSRTGVSIMRMEEGLDTGPYCITQSVEIAERNATQLSEFLAELGAQALIEALRFIEAGSCQWTAQDDSVATYAAKLSKDDVSLSPDLPVAEALRRVRASGPQAPARAIVGGRGVTVVSASRVPEMLSPGSVRCDNTTVVLGFADGAAALRTAKPDGRGEMPGCDWARGCRFAEDTVWGAAR